MPAQPLKVASLGMGWWSDVLADAIQRSSKLKIVSCCTRSEQKRAAFAGKYGCKPAASYEEILADRNIEAVINTTPNNVHRVSTVAAAMAGKHVFLDKPIAERPHQRCEVASGRDYSRQFRYWQPHAYIGGRVVQGCRSEV